MFSNGNYAQYLPQGLQYIPGAYGAYGTSPYGGSGSGQEFGSQGLGQQGPAGGSFAAFGSTQSPQSIGPQIITTLSQLANQVVAQGVAAQQVGVLLGQLAQQVHMQQIAAQASYQGNPFTGAHAFNQLQHQLALQGRVGQWGNALGGVAANPAFTGQGFGGQGIGAAFGQSPYTATVPVGYGGFAPQMQVPQNQAWAINRPAVLQ